VRKISEISTRVTAAVVKVATGASGFRKSIVQILSLPDIFYYFVKNIGITNLPKISNMNLKIKNRIWSR
jgi:hypothetical protein